MAEKDGGGSISKSTTGGESGSAEGRESQLVSRVTDGSMKGGSKAQPQSKLYKVKFEGDSKAQP